MGGLRFYVWRWDDDGWTRLPGVHRSRYAAVCSVVADGSMWGSLYSVLPAGETPDN